MTRVVLYYRVSTEEQREQGYSLGDQREELERYCKDQGYEVLEVIEDQGSGAILERPGLDRVRDLVRSGSVDLVITRYRDRLTREPGIRYILKQEFSLYGTKIKSLDDVGDDDSEEGELVNSFFDSFAKFQRSKIASLTMAGRARKAREGKVVGSGTAPYGYIYSDGSLEIEPFENRVIHTIFQMIADGKTIYEVVAHLKKKGIKSPKGYNWHRSSIRPTVMRDCYTPYTYSELENIVSPQILKTLDPEKEYGIYWYNREYRKKRKVWSETKKKYITKVDVTSRPREEWIAVPIPESGIPREIVDKARANLADNKFGVSSSSNRYWELSGGIAVCGSCGRAMSTIATKTKSRGKAYLYYRCSNDRDVCPNSKNYRALDLERKGIEALQDLYSDNSKIRETVAAHLDKRSEDLRKKDPETEKVYWSNRKVTLQTELDRAIDLAISGVIPKEKLRVKSQEINEQIALAEKEISKLSDIQSSIRRVESRKRLLQELFEDKMKSDLGLIEPVPFYEDEHGNFHGTDQDNHGWLESGAPNRHKLYKDLGIKVLCNREEVHVEISGERLFLDSESPS